MTNAAEFDIAIIGGGVNGCGIARDAAGRGARVVLFEADDLAGATSSASTKLIHGGLRYLEQYEFRLVHEALAERSILWSIAPHLTQPIRFILPHHEGLRPRWMLRAGLFLYDHLGGRGGLEGARALDLRRDPVGAPLKDRYTHGFSYADCQTDDARLVVANAMDAEARGADVRVRTRVTGAVRADGLWRITAKTRDGGLSEATARTLVNAAGPWVNEALGLANLSPASGVRLVKGSHIVTRKLYQHDAAYIFQNGDGRVVFAIPWRDDYTMIGTTDVEFDGDPATIEASEDEIAYLCAAVDDYFEQTVSPSDVVWTWSGVRALVDDGASEARQATRDYVLHLDAVQGAAAVLSVYGGKITTYRRLAEAAIKKLAPHLPPTLKGPWTARAALPGGDFPRSGLPDLIEEVFKRGPVFSREHAVRLGRSYGTRAFEILSEAAEHGFGVTFVGDLCEREVDYLMDKEWAQTAEDVLFRRSKLNLIATAADAERLETYMRARRSPLNDVNGATAQARVASPAA